ncbi:MAG: carbohydrate porin [bacterium]|nr:carbohydrate porin [bacterium]
MNCRCVILGKLCLLVAASVVAGEPAEAGPKPDRTTTTDAIEKTIALDVENDSKRSDWRSRDQLLGDLGGARPWLAKHGMTLEITSLDEGLGTPNENLNEDRSGRYAGLTDVVLSLDTKDAGWWQGGNLSVVLQNVRGGDISAVVGDAQGISNIVGPPGTRFVEYFLVQEFAAGKAMLKVGKQDANADFVVSHGGGEFINSSFGIIPTVPLPTFPSPALGVMGAWSPTSRVRFKAGVWDGAPALGSGSMSTAFDGSGGAVAAAGVEFQPFGGKSLPGTYRLGVWHHSAVELGSDDQLDTNLEVAPADGIYFTIDQGLWQRGSRELALFAQGGWGEADRSAFSRYFGGGLTLSSPFKGRDDDLLGIGIAHAELGDVERPVDHATHETIVELFYRFPVTPWMSLRPDLQWVDRPGGGQGSAFVAGLRVETSF